MIFRFGDGWQMRWSEQDQDWIFEPVPPPSIITWSDTNTDSISDVINNV